MAVCSDTTALRSNPSILIAACHLTRSVASKRIAGEGYGSTWSGACTRVRPDRVDFEILRTQGGDVHVDFRTPIAFLDSNSVLVISGGQIVELHRDGNRWIAKPYFTPDQTAVLARLGRVRRMSLASDGTLWLSCGTQICSTGKAGLRVWQAADGVAGDDWNTFLEDPQGRIWVRSPQHLLVHERDATSFTLRDPPMPELAEIRDNVAMMLDSAGHAARAHRSRARPAGTTRSGSNLPSQTVCPPPRSRTPCSIRRKHLAGHERTGRSGAGATTIISSPGRGRRGWYRTKLEPVARSAGRLLLGTSNGCQMLDEHAGHVWLAR